MPSGLKANWHVGASTERVEVEDVGRVIDLADEPSLNVRLVALLEREGELDAAGVTCPIKDRNDSSCSACPMRQTDPLESIAALCDVGCEQERVLTSIAIHRSASDAQAAA